MIILKKKKKKDFGHKHSEVAGLKTRNLALVEIWWERKKISLRRGVEKKGEK